MNCLMYCPRCNKTVRAYTVSNPDGTDWHCDECGKWLDRDWHEDEETDPGQDGAM
jgi:hypothetical protein